MVGIGEKEGTETKKENSEGQEISSKFMIFLILPKLKLENNKQKGGE